jgi:hypothetical protein
MTEELPVFIRESTLSNTMLWLREHGTDIRVHGNGFLQLDLPEDWRLHVWGHQALPRQAEATPIHDHAFNFESWVLRGRMVNVLHTAVGSAGVSHMWRPSHYVCHPVFRKWQDTRLEPTDVQVELLDPDAQVVMQGESYHQTYIDLHETYVNQTTVTLIKKGMRFPDHKVRVLCPIGRKPDNSFTRYDLREEDLWAIVEEAMR